ncbi:nitroreductase [Kribbella antibiotica]|uniref:Nitroreductase n=1 Tax=Kribbella antibiotica TaxID=190195 RepID=A0A4R4ZSW0_9ACTN|nr:nitroreductase [Kribbella antibiotica]TDD61480.1 nitroreductase [Kribbella antibiotica]
MDDQLSMEQIDILLRAAVAAPSMHNTQPWRFEVNGTVIDVFLDGARALPAEDPTGRAMRIAAGAAVFNLRCAAAHLGLGSGYGLAPNPLEPDLVARIVLEDAQQLDLTLKHLYLQVVRRHTSRLPARPAPPAADSRIGLMQAALAEGAELTWLQKTDAAHLMAMNLDVDLREVGDWKRTAERSKWIGGERVGDGVPSSVLGPRPTSYTAPVRDLGVHPVDQSRPRAAFEADAALAVLSTDRDRPVDHLVAGIALEHVLLAATRDGLTASFFNQPLEFDDLRADVQHLTGKPGFAQMVIRFAHTTQHATSPRRPLADVVRGETS